MASDILEGIRIINSHRSLIAIGIPMLGGGLVVTSSVCMPRGRAKGLLTGTFMLLASLGASFLLFAVAALAAGAAPAEATPLFVPGIVLTVIMGIFTPEMIREYQHFEFRKLAANLFRRS
jgi:hypothetical protein